MIRQILRAARRIAAITTGDTGPDCLPAQFEMEKGPRRPLLLLFRRNRYRPGRLGNALLRGGSFRRVSA